MQQLLCFDGFQPCPAKIAVLHDYLYWLVNTGQYNGICFIYHVIKYQGISGFASLHPEISIFITMGMSVTVAIAYHYLSYSFALNICNSSR